VRNSAEFVTYYRDIGTIQLNWKPVSLTKSRLLGHIHKSKRSFARIFSRYQWLRAWIL